MRRSERKKEPSAPKLIGKVVWGETASFTYDGGGAGSGARGAGGPSPWLAAIERTIAELDKEAAPTEATEVSRRVAELRRRLAEGADDQ